MLITDDHAVVRVGTLKILEQDLEVIAKPSTFFPP
jgi:hypothetical protein